MGKPKGKVDAKKSLGQIREAVEIDERPYYMPKMPEYITDERPPWVPPFKITCGSSATDKYIDYITGRNTSDCYVSNQTVEGYKDMPRPKPHGDSEKPPFQPRSEG